jgi:hypothetical protein
MFRTGVILAAGLTISLGASAAKEGEFFLDETGVTSNPYYESTLELDVYLERRGAALIVVDRPHILRRELIPRDPDAIPVVDRLPEIDPNASDDVIALEKLLKSGKPGTKVTTKGQEVPVLYVDEESEEYGNFIEAVPMGKMEAAWYPEVWPEGEQE